MEALDTQPLYSSDLGPEPCSCDEALALRAELADARRRIANQAESLKVPRIEDVVCIHGLERELARTRFVSVVRGKLAAGWAKMLDEKRAELAETEVAYLGCSLHRDELEAKLAEAERRLREDKHADNTLEWRHMVDALRTELAEANAVVADKAHMLQLYAEQKDALAEAKAAVEAAEKRACNEALTHDNLLEEVESYRELFLAEQRKLAEAHAALADHEAHMLQLYAEQKDALAEAKRAAETWEELCHGQEVLAVQADALVERFQSLATEATAKMAAMEISMLSAYTERNRLVAFLARVCVETAGTRRTPIEGWDPAWHGCVYIDTNVGQMSWHYHDSDAHLFASLPAYEKPWDGHTTAEKYERLWRLTALTAAIP